MSRVLTTLDAVLSSNDLGHQKFGGLFFPRSAASAVSEAP